MRVLSLFVVNWYQECFRVVVDSPRQSIVYNRYATLIFTNPVLLGFSRYQNVNFGSQRDNLRNSDLRSNPCFTRVCGVVRCGEKRWNLLSSQRICNTFATKISKKYRTLFGDRHWRVSFLLCRFCIGSYAVLIF